MEMFSAHVELARQRISPEIASKMMDELEAYHPAVGHSPRGWVDAQISLPAEHLVQATQTAVAVVRDAAQAAGFDAAALAVEVMTETEFGIRQGWADDDLEPVAGDSSNDTIGSTEAAAMLGVTRQRLMQYVDDGRITSKRVGARAHGFRRGDVYVLKRQLDGRRP